MDSLTSSEGWGALLEVHQNDVHEAAKGAAASKMPVLPNLLSGSLAGVYVSFGAILAISVASAMPSADAGVQKLVFGLLFPIALLNIVATGSQVQQRVSPLNPCSPCTVQSGYARIE